MEEERLYVCEDCAERGGSGLQEAEARAALAALSPNNSTCVLCAHLFPWLRSEHCAVALQALLSSLSSSSSSSSSSVLSCSRVALHCELSAGLALREALLARPLAPAAPLALRLLRQQLRPLLPASMREEEGGVTILLSDAGGPRDALVLGERGERKAGRRGRKREQQEEEDEALLSKAQLQSALRAPGAVALLRDNAARLSALPALPLRPPTLSLIGVEMWIGGRYTKFARNMPQSKWVDKGQRIGHSSVEEEICNVILPLTGGTATLGAAGREDRNVRMVGPGRPFYLHISNAMTDQVDLQKAVFAPNGAVQVSNLAVITKADARAIDLAASVKTKSYRLLVRAPGLKAVPSVACPLQILQKTPVRVLHRRGNLVRERQVLAISFLMRGPDLLQVEMETSAGMYIKEWVHGDLGRTNPSLSSIVGCNCTFLSLDVFDVRMPDANTLNDKDEDEEGDE